MANEPNNKRNVNDPENMNKEGDDLPGYPHYPADEDIMNPANGLEKLPVDMQNFTRTPGIEPQLDQGTGGKTTEAGTEEYDDLGIVRGTEADVTKDDLLILGPKEGDLDMGDDELLRTKARPDRIISDDELDMADIDLNDEQSDAMGQGDEENSYYSLGGDRHENLEEDQQQ